MQSTIRLYLDAILAVAIMSALGVIAGFIAGAISGDRTVVIAATAAVFALTGAVLVVRLWRLTRKPALPVEPGA
jgi:membrane associated rhomboid family serine protease